jgi:hypothetical protein
MKQKTVTSQEPDSGRRQDKTRRGTGKENVAGMEEGKDEQKGERMHTLSSRAVLVLLSVDIQRLVSMALACSPRSLSTHHMRAREASP